MTLKLLSFHLVLLASLLGSAPGARAQWLTHTTTIPGTNTNAVFPAGGPSGFATASVTPFRDGFGNGIPGISPNPFTNVTTAFTNFCPLNPGGTFDFLNVTSNDTGDVFLVTFNFSNLAGGVLPAGSTIAFLDVDNNENVLELSGFDQSGNQFGGPWLNQFNGFPAPAAFDYDNAGGGVTLGQSATVGLSGGFYSLTGDPSNQDSAFQGFTTTQPLGSLTFIYSVSDPSGGATLAFDSYGIAIKAVPEPAPTALAVLGGVLALAYSQRRRLRIKFAPFLPLTLLCLALPAARAQVNHTSGTYIHNSYEMELASGATPIDWSVGIATAAVPTGPLGEVSNSQAVPFARP